MAEINIERRPHRSPWPILIALLILAALAFGVWYYTSRMEGSTDLDRTGVTPPAADTSQIIPVTRVI